MLTKAVGANLARDTGIATIVDDDGGIVLPPPPADPSELGDLQVLFAVVDSWSGGFNGGVTLHNDGTAPTAGWQVELDMPYQITNIWNAEIVSHDEGAYVIRNAVWNGAIAQGGEASFGFVGIGQINPSSVQVDTFM